MSWVRDSDNLTCLLSFRQNLKRCLVNSDFNTYSDIYMCAFDRCFYLKQLAMLWIYAFDQFMHFLSSNAFIMKSYQIFLAISRLYSPLCVYFYFFKGILRQSSGKKRLIQYILSTEKETNCFIVEEIQSAPHITHHIRLLWTIYGTFCLIWSLTMQITIH